LDIHIYVLGGFLPKEPGIHSTGADVTSSEENYLSKIRPREYLLLSEHESTTQETSNGLKGNLPSETRTGDHIQLGRRLKMKYEAINIREVINSEMELRKGRTVISCKFIHASYHILLTDAV
jgi:hypothetical protein